VSPIDKQVTVLKEKLYVLEQISTHQTLLEDIWNELGPYAPALTNKLQYRLQKHFNFDDSE
jgi:hypothetical protein